MTLVFWLSQKTIAGYRSSRQVKIVSRYLEPTKKIFRSSGVTVKK